MDKSKDHQKPRGKKTNVFVGPWGGYGGTHWDDGAYHGVREIKLIYERCIDSITVVYDKNDRPVRTEKHGGVGGSKTAEIKLQYPEEYLASVSGYYFPVLNSGTPVIRSLTFKSNRGEYGPYGVEEGTPFSFSVRGGRIIGMYGKSDWYLDSIGFRLSHPNPTTFFNKLHKKI